MVIHGMPNSYWELNTVGKWLGRGWAWFGQHWTWFAHDWTWFGSSFALAFTFALAFALRDP